MKFLMTFLSVVSIAYTTLAQQGTPACNITVNTSYRHSITYRSDGGIREAMERFLKQKGFKKITFSDLYNDEDGTLNPQDGEFVLYATYQDLKELACVPGYTSFNFPRCSRQTYGHDVTVKLGQQQGDTITGVKILFKTQLNNLSSDLSDSLETIMKQVPEVPGCM